MLRWECCYQKMDEGVSCTTNQVRIEGNIYTTVPYNPGPPFESSDYDICNDCGVFRGGYHHQPCDLELCPHCGEQVIGACVCVFDNSDLIDY